MSADLAPPPSVDAKAAMIARTERVVVARPPAEVFDYVVGGPLAAMIPVTKQLPGVSGVTPLTPGPWGGVGQRRQVHLTDGSQTTEQVLESVPGERFRYQVWDYSTAAGKPIAYALGEFLFRPFDGGRTEIVWTYAFRLRGDIFPGSLGAFGRWLMRRVFLDTAYARLMQASLAAIRNTLEGRT
ncbi:SRPBCC family protein [Phenylobacterium sp.]|uniref:SRPBCC family protein n=1 Tax=Phenylobacterium sp. TaxID=1871053 RepID=UPI00374D9493